MRSGSSPILRYSSYWWLCGVSSRESGRGGGGLIEGVGEWVGEGGREGGGE